MRGYGSPTILINGRDVAGQQAFEEASCCRIYADGERVSGAPSVARIAEVLQEACNAERHESHPHASASVCPACLPAYAGTLSALGLGFLMEARWLFPLTAAVLTVAVGALAYRAPTRRGYGPFMLGLVASAVVLGGKFGIESDPIMYGGLALLMGASLWNAWPRHAGAACPACEPGANV